MSCTQPQTTTNEHGFEGKHWRTMGGDLTLFEYLRRDFGAIGGWHPGMGDARAALNLAQEAGWLHNSSNHSDLCPDCRKGRA